MPLIRFNVDKKFLWRALLTTAVFSAFFICQDVAAQVVLTEVNPAGGWVELQNIGDEPLSLSGLSLSRLNDPSNFFSSAKTSLNLTGEIPAKGLLTVPFGMSPFADRISIYNSEGDPLQIVVYGNVVPSNMDPECIENCYSIFDSVDAAPPTGSDSIIASGANWAFASSSRGWFNNAGESGQVPLLNETAAGLAALTPSISTNLASIADPTSASGLYLSAAGRGKIEFVGSLNLTEQASVNTLGNLATGLKIEVGKITFNPEANSVFKNSAATITIEGLPTDRDYALADLIVTDASGTTLLPAEVSALISDFNFATSSGQGVVTFRTSHFTSFEVPTTTPAGREGGGSEADLTAPAVTVTAPSAGVASGTVAVTVLATDTGSGITNLIYYYSFAAADPVVISSVATSSVSSLAYSVDWDTAGLASGDYDLFAVAADAAGNIATSSAVAVNITGVPADTTQPVGTIDLPLAGTLATTTLAIEAAASDEDSGVAAVGFYIDSGILIATTTTASGDGKYSVSWTPVAKGLADGDHFIYAVITDQAGNIYATPSVGITTDTTLPTGTISYSTTDKTKNNVIATLTTDRAATILNNIDDHYTFTDNGTFLFEFVDTVGHFGRATATVANIDRSAPQFSSTTPAGGASVNGTTRFSFIDTERTSPRCSIDRINWSGCGSLSFGDINGFDAMGQGPFILYLRDTDLAGNQGTSSVSYIKDTIKPTFVRATATDATHLRVQFSEDLQYEKLSLMDFKVLDGETENAIVGLTEDNGIVILTLERAIAGTQPEITLTLNPYKPQSIKDLANNELTETAVLPVFDGVAPTISSARTTGDQSFEINFSEALADGAGAPQAGDLSAYAVRGGNVEPLPVVGLTTSGGKITVSLSANMYYGDIVHFTVAAGSHITDTLDNVFNGDLAYTGTLDNNVTTRLPSAGAGGGGGGGGATAPATISIPVGQVLGIEFFRFAKNLSYCQTNNDIKELQKRLMRDGYMATSTPTTYFGVKTLAAVKKYQRAHSLPDTGYVGPLTREVLNGKARSGAGQELSAILEQSLNIQSLLESLKKGQ